MYTNRSCTQSKTQKNLQILLFCAVGRRCGREWVREQKTPTHHVSVVKRAIASRHWRDVLEFCANHSWTLPAPSTPLITFPANADLLFDLEKYGCMWRKLCISAFDGQWFVFWSKINVFDQYMHLVRIFTTLRKCAVSIICGTRNPFLKY